MLGARARSPCPAAAARRGHLAPHAVQPVVSPTLTSPGIPSPIHPHQHPSSRLACTQTRGGVLPPWCLAQLQPFTACGYRQAPGQKSGVNSCSIACRPRRPREARIPKSLLSPGNPRAQARTLAGKSLSPAGQGVGLQAAWQHRRRTRRRRPAAAGTCLAPQCRCPPAPPTPPATASSHSKALPFAISSWPAGWLK